MSKQKESYEISLDTNMKAIRTLEQENHSLNEVKDQLDAQLHSLKEKLISNENLSDKLKKDLELSLEHENDVREEMRQMLDKKEEQVLELKMEVNMLQQNINENKIGKIIVIKS